LIGTLLISKSSINRGKTALFNSKESRRKKLLNSSNSVDRKYCWLFDDFLGGADAVGAGGDRDIHAALS